MMSIQFENILIAKQITPTPMRVMVLEYILNHHSAVSLIDLEKEFDHSDKTTLYRTVKTFEEKGLLHDIKDGNNATKYALCAAECSTGVHYDLHLHFYCTECKELICLSKDYMPAIKLPSNYQLNEINFIARGTCDVCTKNANELHHLGNNFV